MTAWSKGEGLICQDCWVHTQPVMAMSDPWDWTHPNTTSK